jgi:hypothetical protein
MNKALYNQFIVLLTSRLLQTNMFMAGDLGMVYYGTIPFSSRNLAKGHGHYSPERSCRP